MTSRKKLKTGDGESSIVQVCVIHTPDSKCESFIPLTEERLEKLNSVKQKRLSQPATSPFRFPEICSQIPDSISPGFGYHRDCYQSFTKNLNRLQDEASKLPDSNNPARVPRGAGDRVIFQKDCIFCRKTGRKKVRKQSSWTTEGTTTFDYEGGRTVQAFAEEKNCEELLIRIRGVDLFSCEAHYHPSCRRQFTQDPSHWRSKDPSNKQEQVQREEAHSEAYHAVCKSVESTLIDHKGIMKLTDLQSSILRL